MGLKMRSYKNMKSEQKYEIQVENAVYFDLEVI